MTSQPIINVPPRHTPSDIPVRGIQSGRPHLDWFTDHPGPGPALYRGCLKGEPGITLAIITHYREGYSLAGAFIPDNRDGECFPTLLAAMNAAEQSMDRWVQHHTRGWRGWHGGEDGQWALHRWHAVPDTLPSTPRVVIATDGECQWMAIYLAGRWATDADDDIDSVITHWREQPALPGEGSQP